jgi:outer membrane protein assembly factor BamB
MKHLPALLAATLVAAQLGPVQADPWPNWRGPNFNGSTLAASLPSVVTKDSARWSTPLPGRAGSTPIIWGQHLFLTTPDEAKNLNLLCLDSASGQLRWSKTVAEGDKEKGKNNMAAPSPVTDGQRVIAMFGTGDLAAFDFSGRELWHRNLGKEFGSLGHMWIYGSSPLLFQGTLYVQVLQRDEVPNDYPLFDGKPKRESYLLALDPATGKSLWRHVRKTDSTKESHESYATPFPYSGRNSQELLIVGGDHISGHRLGDGTETWRARLYEKRDDWYRIVTSPVAHEGLIFASGPKGQPVVALRDGGQGDVTATHKVWEFRDAPTDWATPLVYGGHLFVLDGGKKVLSKLDPKSGKALWSGKLEVPDVIWGSPTAADGKIYLLSEGGTLFVCSAGDEFKVLSKLSFDEGTSRSSVALANDRLFVRTGSQLHCFGSK